MALNGQYADLKAAIVGMGLAGPGEPCEIDALSGGVSCDVFFVRTPVRTFCLKHALPKLRVAADWLAPAERSHAEVAWMRLVASLDPYWVPAILGEDRARHMFAMEYFPPVTHPVWKSLLADGQADAGFAAEVAQALVTIHAATAGRENIARDFDNGAQFYALRIDAYLLHTAAKHEDVAGTLHRLADNLAAARIALMMGDVSPKNILCGPDSPVFLDAETCCYGDPVFDLAFCLNHLLLKGVWHPEHAIAYAECFDALAETYLTEAGWEDRDGLEQRTAELLPALLLARVDGKSPVEYITRPADKTFVRQQAKAFLRSPAASLAEILDIWTEALVTRHM